MTSIEIATGFDPEQHFTDEVKSLLDGGARLNIIMAGKLGVGKSSLLNGIFGTDEAPTGVGASVTTRIKRYPLAGSPIAIYDTPGIELGRDHQGVIGDYLAEIRKNASDPDRRIHFALYCINSNGSRYEDFELDVIRQLATELPVFVVLTQCLGPEDPRALDLARKIDELGVPMQEGHVFRVLARPLTFGPATLAPFGLPELVEAIYRALPEAAARTWASHQRVSLAVKVAEAQSVVRVNAATAAGIAALPLPILDAIPLSALQFSMLAKITTTFGLKVDIKALVVGLAGIMGIAAVARQVARGLLNFFPVVGNAINAGIAAQITQQMGNAYIKAGQAICLRQIAGETVSNDVTAEILAEFKNMWQG
ncbi:GTP-binding protein [Paractinoplanes ferrugineus]|uniref:GTPase n=1 Tax=Paractinoplanes ferrugineus TaxID=113564 RepID=A0A919J9F3_9ACTN|nr:GTPase [Actinoplanes ferrugineus]GIE13026.1 GTPase [Actinoplanes ferrugineus]